MTSITQINELDFYSKQAVLLTAEDRSAFQNIASTYQAELNPHSAAERTLFGLILLAVWNIERVNRLESAQASADGVDPLLSQSPTAKRLVAYRLNAERSFHKNLAEYRKLKAETSRQEEAVGIAKPKLKNEPNCKRPQSLVVGQFEFNNSTMSEISHNFVDTPAAIAGVVFSA